MQQFPSIEDTRLYEKISTPTLLSLPDGFEELRRRNFGMVEFQITGGGKVQNETILLLENKMQKTNSGVRLLAIGILQHQGESQ